MKKSNKPTKKEIQDLEEARMIAALIENRLFAKKKSAKNKETLSPGDVVKITDGLFQDFVGEFIKIVPKAKSGKSFDMARIEFYTLGKKVIGDMGLSELKKIIPICRCGQPLDMDKKQKSTEEFLNYLDREYCDRCVEKNNRFIKKLVKLKKLER